MRSVIIFRKPPDRERGVSANWRDPQLCLASPRVLRRVHEVFVCIKNGVRIPAVVAVGFDAWLPNVWLEHREPFVDQRIHEPLHGKGK